MPSVAINKPKTPVTKGSHGIAAATLPNICKMPPPPPPFAPTPLPNVGQSGKMPSGYSTTVKIEGHAVAITGATFGSSGDIASRATGGGIVSNNAEGPTKFLAPGSLDVQIEGKNVQLLGDQMLNNCGPSGSPPNSATLQGENQMSTYVPVQQDAAVEGDHRCECCGGAAHSQAQADGEYMSEAQFYDVANNPGNAALLARIRASSKCRHILPPANKKPSGCNKYYRTTSAEQGNIETDWGLSAPSYREFRGVPRGANISHRVPKSAGGCPGGQGNLAPTTPKCQKLEDELGSMQERCVRRLRR